MLSRKNASKIFTQRAWFANKLSGLSCHAMVNLSVLHPLCVLYFSTGNELYIKYQKDKQKGKEGIKQHLYSRRNCITYHIQTLSLPSILEDLTSVQEIHDKTTNQILPPNTNTSYES